MQDVCEWVVRDSARDRCELCRRDLDAVLFIVPSLGCFVSLGVNKDKYSQAIALAISAMHQVNGFDAVLMYYIKPQTRIWWEYDGWLIG